MQPIKNSHNIETAMREAMYVVDAGEQNVTYPMYLIWAQQYKGAAINFGDESLLSRYEEGVKSSLETKMFAEIKLIKINDKTLGLLYPVGNQSNHEKMLRVVSIASGITDNSRRITNFTNFHVVLHAIKTNEEVNRKHATQKIEGLEEEQQNILGRVDFVIQVDGPWMSDFLFRTQINQLSPTVLGTLTFPYNMIEDRPCLQVYNSWANIHSCNFMGLKIAFIHNSGLFSNHEARKQKFEKWFPQNPTVVSVEKLVETLAPKPESLLLEEKNDVPEKAIKRLKIETKSSTENKPGPKSESKITEKGDSNVD